MNVGITGANGFIGRNVYSALIENQNSLKISKCEKFDKPDHSVLNIGSLRNFVADKDVIFHFAGVNIDKNNWKILEVNTVGTLKLLEAIRLSSTSNSVKLIFSSSFQVYGFKPTPALLSEDSALKPTNIYGLSKKFAEDLILKYSNDYGIRCLILRFSNVYGPGCRPNYNSVISTFIDSAIRNKPIVLYGGGNSSRDFIFINDVVNANLRSFSYEQNFPEVFNICTGVSTSLKILIDEISSILQSTIQVDLKENGVVDFLAGTPTKSQEELGFTSQVSILEGLKKTIKWFKERTTNENRERET